eukprot:COSAG01_NODE_608_length_14865_cov_5.517879_10_plen_85_part_00
MDVAAFQTAINGATCCSAQNCGGCGTIDTCAPINGCAWDYGKKKCGGACKNYLCNPRRNNAHSSCQRASGRAYNHSHYDQSHGM